MILVDTSVWVDHFRSGDSELSDLLNAGQALIHPFVIGELACGNLKNRAAVLSLLHNLPFATIAEDPEALCFIERHQLCGVGIGFIDVHLLASTRLSGGALLWTRDKRLHQQAVRLTLAKVSV